MGRFAKFATAVLAVAWLAGTGLVVGAAFVEQHPTPTRRLESVSWNPTIGVMTITVARVASKKVESTDVYEIDLDKAVMSTESEARGFSEEEAARVIRVMDAVAKYARDSVDWWEAGKGEPIGAGKIKAE